MSLHQSPAAVRAERCQSLTAWEELEREREREQRFTERRAARAGEQEQDARTHKSKRSRGLKTTVELPPIH